MKTTNITENVLHSLDFSDKEKELFKEIIKDIKNAKTLGKTDELQSKIITRIDNIFISKRRD